jgi:hypothetical protein
VCEVGGGGRGKEAWKGGVDEVVWVVDVQSDAELEEELLFGFKDTLAEKRQAVGGAVNELMCALLAIGKSATAKGGGIGSTEDCVDRARVFLAFGREQHSTRCHENAVVAGVAFGGAL